MYGSQNPAPSNEAAPFRADRDLAFSRIVTASSQLRALRPGPRM
jgi:hypothetical protein